MVVFTCTKFRKNFGNVWLFFKVVIPTESMFTTTTFTSIRFTFIIRYGENEQPNCDSNFNLFGFLVAPNSFFPWSFRQNSLRLILFIKLKTACFKTNVCFENAKKINAHILHRKRNGNIFIKIKLAHEYSIIIGFVNNNQSDSQLSF